MGITQRVKELSVNVKQTKEEATVPANLTLLGENIDPKYRLVAYFHLWSWRWISSFWRFYILWKVSISGIHKNISSWHLQQKKSRQEIFKTHESDFIFLNSHCISNQENTLSFLRQYIWQFQFTSKSTCLLYTSRCV